jgi:hypothetical protein
MAKNKKTNKDLKKKHIKQKIEKQGPHYKPGATSCDPEG